MVIFMRISVGTVKIWWLLLAISLITCVLPACAQSDSLLFGSPKFYAEIDRAAEDQIKRERQHKQFLEDPNGCFALLSTYKNYKHGPLSENRIKDINDVTELKLIRLQPVQYTSDYLLYLLDSIAMKTQTAQNFDLAQYYIQLARLLHDLPARNKYVHHVNYIVGLLAPYNKDEKPKQFSLADKIYCWQESDRWQNEALKLLDANKPQHLNPIAQMFELKALQSRDSNKEESKEFWKRAIKARLSGSPFDKAALLSDLRYLFQADCAEKQLTEAMGVISQMKEICVSNGGSASGQKKIISSVDFDRAFQLARECPYLKSLAEFGGMLSPQYINEQTMDLYESGFLAYLNLGDKNHAAQILSLLRLQEEDLEVESDKKTQMNTLIDRLHSLLTGVQLPSLANDDSQNAKVPAQPITIGYFTLPMVRARVTKYDPELEKRRKEAEGKPKDVINRFISRRSHEIQGPLVCLTTEPAKQDFSDQNLSLAVQKVAKRQKLDVVFNSNGIYFGGKSIEKNAIDITLEVSKELQSIVNQANRKPSSP